VLLALLCSCCRCLQPSRVAAALLLLLWLLLRLVGLIIANLQGRRAQEEQAEAGRIITRC